MKEHDSHVDATLIITGIDSLILVEFAALTLYEFKMRGS